MSTTLGITKRWTTWRLVAILAAILALIVMLDKPPTAGAVNGANLASFDAIVTAGIPPCASGVGTGLAYDVTTDSLVLSCWGSNVLERVDAVTHLNDGAVAIAGLPFGDDLNAMAYDSGRNRVWACNGHSHVVLLDLTTGTVDVSQAPIAVAACTDGLAYDGADDTLWVSPDVSGTVYHYDLAGLLIGSFVATIGSCGNSGIAVGGAKLYLANNGCSEIYESNKDGTGSVLFASFAPFRLEDLECDNETFAPVGLGAIWSQDAYDRILNAWEIPADQCASGGGGSPPRVTKHWSQTNVCFERDNDGDGKVSEDPIDFTIDPATGLLTVPFDNDGDGVANEDPSECPGGTSLGTPLVQDAAGEYQIEAVVKKDGTVSSYNPGQVYAVSTVEVLSAIAGLVITENYVDCTSTVPDLLTLNPAPGGGGGSVVVVILNGAGVPVQVLDATSPEVVETATNAVVTLGPQAAGTTIKVYVKFAPGLKGFTLAAAANSCTNENWAQVLDGLVLGPPITATAVLELTAK